MIKIALLTLSLLGGVLSLSSRHPLPNEGLALAETDHGTYSYYGEQLTYKVTTVTVVDLEIVWEYWQNKTDGDYCYGLFELYYNLTIEVDIIIEQALHVIEEYNHNCSDFCFPGYVNCPLPGWDHDPCMLPEDCCTTQYPGYEWCLSGTPGYEVCVPDCCIEDVEVWCFDECVRIADLPVDYLPVEGSTPISMDTCCHGQECCTEEGTYWLSRLQTCCTPGETLTTIVNGEVHTEYCCPELYCPDLFKDYLPMDFVFDNSN